MFLLGSLYVITFYSFFLIASSLSLLPQPAFYLIQFHQSLPKNSQHLLPWNWSDSSSSKPSSHCQWVGVSCYSNKSGFQVKALNLSGFGLSGVLNNSMLYLCQHKHLLYLDLSGNNFSGDFPSLLGNCGRLKLNSSSQRKQAWRVNPFWAFPIEDAIKAWFGI